MAKATVMRKPSTQKAWRFGVRASASQKKVIAEAARITGTTINDFVLEQSLTAAQHVIADRVQFRLSRKQWKKFCDTLDAPPNAIHSLRKLLTKPNWHRGEKARQVWREAWRCLECLERDGGFKVYDPQLDRMLNPVSDLEEVCGGYDSGVEFAERAVEESVTPTKPW
jgi:uncharacterized protein (DUF1778 family)